MSATAAVMAFLPAVFLLTIIPGPDTLLVLRSAALGGAGAGLRAISGIALGLMLWGTAVALGLAVLLAAAPLAYRILTWAGAGYLIWIGVTSLIAPRGIVPTAQGPAAGRRPALMRGLVTNLLNPKIGVFYISFLPQFVPAGWPAGPSIFGLALLHILVGSLWLAALVFGFGRIAAVLRRGSVAAALDRVTGVIFIAFGLRLVLTRPA